MDEEELGAATLTRGVVVESLICRGIGDPGRRSHDGSPTVGAALARARYRGGRVAVRSATVITLSSPTTTAIGAVQPPVASCTAPSSVGATAAHA